MNKKSEIVKYRERNQREKFMDYVLGVFDVCCIKMMHMLVNVMTKYECNLKYINIFKEEEEDAGKKLLPV